MQQPLVKLMITHELAPSLSAFYETDVSRKVWPRLTTTQWASIIVVISLVLLFLGSRPGLYVHFMLLKLIMYA